MDLSIVIPVYKAERFLKECIDSVLSIDFCEFEVIAVNDASPDNSLDILQKYENTYENFHIINNPENQGTGCSRNNGLAKATGRYLYFLDCDDYIVLENFRDFYRYTIENDLDIGVSDFIHLKTSGNLEEFFKMPFSETKTMSGKDFFINFKKTRVPTPGIQQGSNLYRRSVFIDNNVIFPPKLLQEDTYIFAVIFPYAKKVRYKEFKHMVYRIRPDSYMRISDLRTARFKSVEEIIEFLNGLSTNAADPSYKKALNTHLGARVTSLFLIYKHINDKKPVFTTKRRTLLKMFNTYFFRHKIYALPMIVCPTLGLSLWSKLTRQEL